MEIEQILQTQIENEAQAISYLKSLHSKDMLFNPDDRASDIVWSKTYERVFDDNQAKLYDARMEEVFKYLADPHEICMEIMGF